MANTKTKTVPRAHPRITGGLEWILPDTNGLHVQWWGPGCGLVLAATKAGGIFTSIIFDGYAKEFETPKDAKKAFAEFYNRSTEEGS